MNNSAGERTVEGMTGGELKRLITYLEEKRGWSKDEIIDLLKAIA